MALPRNYTLSDLKDEIYYFDKNWRRIFKKNNRAIYVAKIDNASVTITIVAPNGKRTPLVVQRYKKGSKIVVIGLAVHSPPHSTTIL